MPMHGKWLTRANGLGCIGLIALALLIATAIWTFTWLGAHYGGGVTLFAPREYREEVHKLHREGEDHNKGR